MGRFECQVCGGGPMKDGRTVYRQSEKGESPVIWRCQHHLDEQPDDEVVEIVSMIERGDSRTN